MFHMVEVTMCLNRTASMVKFNARKRKYLHLEYWEISSECTCFLSKYEQKEKNKDNLGLNIE